MDQQDSVARNLTINVQKEHIADAKALARLAGMDYKAVLSVCLARGIEAALHEARRAAGGGE